MDFPQNLSYNVQKLSEPIKWVPESEGQRALTLEQFKVADIKFQSPEQFSFPGGWDFAIPAGCNLTVYNFYAQTKTIIFEMVFEGETQNISFLFQNGEVKAQERARQYFTKRGMQSGAI